MVMKLNFAKKTKKQKNTKKNKKTKTQETFWKYLFVFPWLLGVQVKMEC